MRYSWTESVRPDGKTGSLMKLSFRLFDVPQPGGLQELVRDLLYKGKSAEEYKTFAAGERKEEFAAALEEYRRNPEWSMPDEWFYQEEQNLVLAGNYACVSSSVSGYSGGAHPNWAAAFYVLDLEIPRRLFLKDIITGGALSRLAAITERELRLFSEEMTGEALPPGKALSGGIYFEDKIPPSEDFYPAREGLFFQWDPYEIAPYAAGGVEISISWEELAPLLSPEGKKLAAAFGR